MSKKFIVNHGWQYVWCDPDQIGSFSIREVIKGPFTKPKIAYPVPTITYCQTDSKGNLHEPPVCWVEHLSNGYRGLDSDKFRLKKDDSMYKTYTDVNCSLGRICLIEGQKFSQGIPDPWTSSPFPKGISKHQFLRGSIKTDLGRQLSQLLRSRSHQNNGKEERCLCCQKKFLFECPDEENVCSLRDRNFLNCSCLDCHGKPKKPAHDTSDNCMCLYLNRALEKNLLKTRERRDSESDNSSRRRRSFSEEESSRENLICTCSRNRVPSTDDIFANGNGNEKTEPQRVKVWYEEDPRGNLEEEQQKEKISFPARVKSEAEKMTVFEKDTKNPPVKAEKPRRNSFISREVQTESSDAFIAKDKGRQNDKSQRRCADKDKRNDCPTPGVLPPCNQHFMYPNSKLVYSYPCTYANYFMTQNTRVPQFLGGSGKRKKKKKREKESQEELEDESASNFSPMKKDRGEPMISKCKCSESKPQYACEKVIRHQPSNLPYDQLKLIAENKLRNYMDRRKLPMDAVKSKFVYNSKPLLMPSRFRDIFEGRGGDCTEEEFEKYRQIYRFKPKERIVSSSGDENRCSSSKIKIQKPRSSSDVTNKMNKEVPTKIKLPKEIIESEECITYRPTRSRESSTKRIRRRRRLSKGKKRKRKSLGSRPVVLVKPPKRSPKNAQADDSEVSGMDQSRLPSHLKNMTFRVAENHKKVSEMLDYCKVNNLRYVNPAGNFHYKPCSRVVPGALARIREEVTNHRYEPSEYIKRQSIVDGVLEKISGKSIRLAL